MLPGSTKVADTSRFANPYRPAVTGWTNAKAVAAYRWHLAQHPELIAAAQAELPGRNLYCYCALDQECHADLLLAIANGPDWIPAFGAPRAEPGSAEAFADWFIQ
jgi:hypothetical protein